MAHRLRFSNWTVCKEMGAPSPAAVCGGEEEKEKKNDRKKKRQGGGECWCVVFLLAFALTTNWLINSSSSSSLRLEPPCVLSLSLSPHFYFLFLGAWNFFFSSSRDWRRMRWREPDAGCEDDTAVARFSRAGQANQNRESHVSLENSNEKKSENRKRRSSSREREREPWAKTKNEI